MASNLFSFQMLRGAMHEVVSEKVWTPFDVLTEYEARHEAVSLKSVLNHFISDVFARIGFGVEQRPMENGVNGYAISDFCRCIQDRLPRRAHAFFAADVVLAPEALFQPRRREVVR
uniref:Uncharacterized protein n=1 Tax=Globisporangium ultimum (strain ATCC 200006 / CBS 805.95 / DAOM BR144) TaxID=431595 RepID=K3X952_GLOUD